MNYNYYLGFLNWDLFLAMVIFALIGVGVNLLIHSQKRDQNSPNTPVKFSFLFLLRDNWKSILLTIILILLTIRFGPMIKPDMFKPEELASPLGTEKWLFASLVVGLGFNFLLQIWKDKTNWLKVKRTNGNDR